ncbi:MAG: right-handed parallel beta-helix repeat-containing protein, partial [Candidatus Kariarchaeaceae archaeon]
GSGINIVDSHYNYIIANNISGYPTAYSYGIVSYNSWYNLFASNVVTAQYNGMMFDYSVDNIIRANEIYGTTNIAMYLGTGSNSNSIHFNYIHNAWSGLRLSGVERNFITNNNISSNGNDGIFLSNGCISNNIRNNTISWNGDGVYLFRNGNEFNRIYANTIAYNSRYGINIESGSNTNYASWNNFIGNNLGFSQGFDNGTDNSINNNYWNEWTTPDFSPRDNIVDISYPLDGPVGRFDMAPLTFMYYVSGGQITYPVKYITLTGIVTVNWTPLVDTYNHTMTYRLRYSPDGGFNNIEIAMGLTTTSYVWDTSQYPNTMRGKLLLISNNGVGFTMGFLTDRSFYVQNPDSLSQPVFTNPIGDLTVNQGDKVEITWDAAIDHFEHPVYYSLFYSDGTSWTGMVDDQTTTKFVWETTKVEAGTYLIKIIADDKNGLTVETTSEFKIIISASQHTTGSTTGSQSTTTKDNETKDPGDSSETPALDIPFTNISIVFLTMGCLTILVRKTKR